MYCKAIERCKECRRMKNKQGPLPVVFEIDCDGCELEVICNEFADDDGKENHN